MTKREIVQLSLSHKETEEIPYYIKSATPVRIKLQEYFGAEDVDDAIGNYLVSFTPRHKCVPKPGSGRFYYDEFGCLWQGTETNIGQVKGHVLQTPLLCGYRFPDAANSSDFECLRELRNAHPDKYLVANLTSHALLERAFNLRGMPQFMMDIYDHPDFARELLDRILEYDWQLAEQALKFDIDAVKINDDWGDQRGVSLGPDTWRALIKPRITDLCDRIRRKKTVDIFLHSDGNIADIMPDIIEMGMTTVNPVQPEVMDIFELKKQFGKDITFFGGISTQCTMPFGTVDEVTSETRELVRAFRRGGGFILSPGLIVQEDVPMENILVFIRLCTEQDF